MASEQVQNVIKSWQTRAPQAIQAGVPAGYVSKIAQDDISRAMQGHRAMSSAEAGATFHSIINGDAFVEKKPKHGILDLPGNALSDIGNVAKGFIPGVAHFVESIPGQTVDLGLLLGGRKDIREKYGLSDHSVWDLKRNPLDALRDVAKMPLINYTPGVNTAANLTTSEGRKHIMEHPVITALDVLPAAKEASAGIQAVRGVTTEAGLAAAESSARQAATEAVLSKLKKGKYVNQADLSSLSKEGLETIVKHAEDATTDIKVPSRIYAKVSQELASRLSDPSREPSFRPMETVSAGTKLIPDPSWTDPLKSISKITEEITPEEISAQHTILNSMAKSLPMEELSNGVKKLVTPANDFGSEATHYVTQDASGRINSFLSMSRDAAGNPLVDMIWRDAKEAPKGISKKLYEAADADGWDIKNASAAGMTDAGRAARASYLGLSREAPMIEVPNEVTRPIQPALPKSTAEALAEGRPIKALSRATGLSDKVIEPIAERLGVTEGMRSLYKALSGTLPRKYQPKLEEQLRLVGGELADYMEKLEPSQQASFYKDVMLAAMESADTIKAANLDPHILAGVNILRQSTDEITRQLVNADEVVPVPLPEGGTALFSKGNPVVNAWERIEAHMQRRPKDWSKTSVVDQHVRWTRKAEALRAAYEKALDTNAPLSFQKLIEQKILNQLAIKMQLPEAAVEMAQNAANVLDKVKAGKYVGKGDIQSMSFTSLEYINKLAHDSSLGIKIPSRVAKLAQDEMGIRLKSGNMGPMDLMSPQLEEAIVQKVRTGDYLQYMKPEELEKMIDDSTSYWRKLKAQGYDPVPVPYVRKTTDIGKETFIQPVPEGMSVGELDRFRSAVFGPDAFRPYQDDISVALTREAVEQLRYDATRDFHRNFVGKLARDPESVLKEYALLHPELSRPDLREAILKDYVAYDATLDHPFRAEWKQGLDDTGAQLLPKPVATQLNNLVRRDQLPVKGVFNRVNKTFRFFVLTSPRHVSHIAGGGLTQMLMRDPMAITDIVDGFRMVKEGRMPIDLPQGIDGFTPEEIFNVAGGRTIGRIAKEGHVKFRNFEEFLANTLKATDYLFNKNKALKKGLSDEYAHSAGIEAASKALAVFEDMSPFERQYVRSFMPFYGFTRHLMRYLLSYPGDHPYKAALISNIVNREFEDWNSGFPRTWNQLFFMGKPNDSGDITAIDFKSLNPFRTVSNNFTFAGILSQSTPWIGGPMAFMGINNVTGSGELYPDLSYDPATGSLVTKRKGGLLKIAEAFVPQIASVDHYIKFSADMRNLAKNNPEAYRQQLYSTLGIPFEPKHINIPLQISRTQKNQLRVATQAVDDAMNGTGSTDKIREFTYVPFRGQLLPGNVVASYVDQLQGLINSNPNLTELGIVPKIINPRK